MTLLSPQYPYPLGMPWQYPSSGVAIVRGLGQMGIGVDTFKYPEHPALTLSALPPELAWQVGIRANGSEYDFLAACAGDTDNKITDSPDVWTISSRDRLIDGEHIAPGEPYHHVNDATTN